MASHVVIFLQASYFLAGIFFADFPCKAFIKLYHILLFVCDLCLFTGIAVVSLDRSTFWVVNSYYIAAGVSILKAFCMQRYYRNEFVKLYQYIIGFNKEMKNFSEMSNTFMGKFAIYILFVLINVAMIFVFPVYKLLMTDVSISDVGARVYPSWYPWSTHTTTRYTITLIVQIVIVSFVMCQLTFCLTSYIGVTIAVQTGFNCLGNRIIDLENEVLQRIRGGDGSGSGASTQIAVPVTKQQFDDTLMEVFLDVVKSHQRLNRWECGFCAHFFVVVSDELRCFDFLVYRFTKDAVGLFTWIIPDVVVLGVVSSISVPATFMKVFKCLIFLFLSN